MGNKFCKPCFPAKSKRVRKTTNSSATLPSITDLSLENFLEANANPLPINDNIPPFICQICFESKPLNDSFNVEGCTHFYCTRCTVKYIVSKLQDNIVNLVCPESGCCGVLNPYYCKPILPNNVLEWWEKALTESMIPEKAKFYCPFNDCSALLFNDCLKGVVIRDTTCPHCKRSVCVQCKAPWHPELSCEKFQRMKDRNDDLLRDLAKRRNWRRCPNCKHYVEKDYGCNEMKCRLVFLLCLFSSYTMFFNFWKYL
ncbi:E3 ubiquitin-protein ligase RSL1-like [Gastrolobium bilobum]|uniref:E3 ubiquitin-protein ligase RSL1-like n=1 Tax=Gastrolobium bilobum TaxID=150636 RepID=UPI002AB1404E|nr:E3 ubiquitin-protein ligase RSL1-like [Gastrolobium bilobum]